MACLIGVDVGTSGIKSILMRKDGRILATAFEEYPLLLPRPGWTEQRPDDWWAAACRALRRLIAGSGVAPSALKALSFSGQMHSLVLVDEHHVPLRPAILWNDQRTTPQCREITRTIGARRLLRLVSNPALEGFTLPKLLWVKKHEPAVWKRIHKMMMPKDYIAMRLTGRIGMETADGSGTMMMDLKKNDWSAPLLEAFDIPSRILPPLRRSFDIAGEVTPEAAAQCGLPAGMPVVYGAGDNACAAVGNGAVEEGLAAASIGTSGTFSAPTAQLTGTTDGKLHLHTHPAPGLWYWMGVMLSAGYSLQWWRNHFGAAEAAVAAATGRDPYEYLTEEAAQAPPGAEGLIWLPYLTGERTPHADSAARGVLFGLTARHTRAHVLRAVMEGVAFGMRDSLELLRKRGVPIRQIRLTGGGANSPLWRQIQADVYGQEVVTINMKAGPAFGAAVIAGVGAGAYPDFPSACRKLIKVDERIAPIPRNVELYNRTYRLYRDLYPALKTAMARAGRLE